VQVHLALEDDKLFKENERHSKASVTLTMAGGATPKPDTVQGIASLVASSVGGLEPEHVTIVDSRGQALTMQDEGSVAGLTSRQLAVQREVETYMQEKADKLLSSLVGPGNARVQVSAAINFDKVERTTQAVDPEKCASTEQGWRSPRLAAAGRRLHATATSYENTRSVENFSGAIGNVKKLTVACWSPTRSWPMAPTATTAAPPTVAHAAPKNSRASDPHAQRALGVDSTRDDLRQSAPFDIGADGGEAGLGRRGPDSAIADQACRSSPSRRWSCCSSSRC
jgi:flagellar M-ring protein FliF